MNVLIRNLTLLAFSFAATSAPLAADCYSVEKLVSDMPLTAANIDPNLVNPWGLVFDDSSNLSVANNGPSLATSYGCTGTVLTSLFNAKSMPTGMERNDADNAFFFIYHGQQFTADYIFTTANGMILAYAGDADPNNAIVVADRSANKSVYTGLTVGNYQGVDLLFATDFYNGNVDVFDAMFNYLYSFTDTTLPEGFAPFNARLINNNLYVSYALQNSTKNNPVVGMGNGFVDIFRPDGVLLNQLVWQDELNAPWGMTLAPEAFGEFGGALLVGNFGNGVINAYNPISGEFLGQLTDENGTIISIDGLRSLKFRCKDFKNLYFTAAPNGESDGLVGRVHYYFICGLY